MLALKKKNSRGAGIRPQRADGFAVPPTGKRCHPACGQETFPSLPGSRLTILGRDARSELIHLN